MGDARAEKKRRCGESFEVSAADLRALLEPVLAVFGVGGAICLELSGARLRASRYADSGTHAVEASMATTASSARAEAQQPCQVRVSARALAACLLEVPDDCRMVLAVDEERRQLCVSSSADGRLAVATTRLALCTASGEATMESWQQLMASPAPVQLSLRALASFARRADDLSAVECSLTQEAAEDESYGGVLVLQCETCEARAKGEVELRAPLSYDAVAQSEAHRVENVPVCALADAVRAIEAVARGEDAVAVSMEPWGVLLWYYYAGARTLEVKVPILRYPKGEGS